MMLSDVNRLMLKVVKLSKTKMRTENERCAAECFNSKHITCTNKDFHELLTFLHTSHRQITQKKIYLPDIVHKKYQYCNLLLTKE